MRKTIGTLAVMMALYGCTGGVGYDPSPDFSPAAIADAKADGAFGSVDLRLGDRVTGSAAGTAFSLYALELEATDQIRVNAARTSGDAEPGVYLYRGTEQYIAPTSYDTGPGTVTLDYTLTDGGEYHIVLKAYHGAGAGEFELSAECTGGACAGISADPLQRQSECIEAAAQCAIADLPRFGGAVGPVRSRDIFNACLDAQADQACRTACDDEGAPVCGQVVAALPGLADQDTSCHAVLSTCLSDCAEMGGYYTAYSIGETAAMACWSGYNGNCAEFIEGHEACGGTEYAAGSAGECYARCAATEGAWDEGPWDGCTDECATIARQHDDYIRGIADDAGEYVSIDSSDAFATVAFDALPEGVKRPVARRIAAFAEGSAMDGGTDTASVSEENVFTISRAGEVVGYMVGLEYDIDHTLFDGGGENLWFNVQGDLVYDAEWWG